MHSFLIGAATSNSGKTTITMGLLRAMTRKGLKVQPFKCGPDYIDPMFHKQACGNESVNLDTVMSSPEHVKEIYHRYGLGADVCIVEGVMGLYDGRDRWHGSSAEIAMLLDVPVILVVNAKSVAYSVAPLIYGFKNFCPVLHFDRLSTPHFDCAHYKLSSATKPETRCPKIAGVIFNMVGSEKHFQYLKQACDDAGVECLGYLGRNDKLQIPSRHLGLSLTEIEKTETLINNVADEITEHVNLDKMVNCKL